MKRMLLVLLLVGCANQPGVKDLPEREPPRVDCKGSAGDPVGPWPVLWFLMGPSYAIELLGLIERDRTMRAAEHACIERLKAKGVIR